MPEQPETNRSHLFTLRLWLEALDSEHTELRGVVLHVRTGTRCTVQDWPALQAFLVEHIGVEQFSPSQSSGDEAHSSDE